MKKLIKSLEELDLFTKEFADSLIVKKDKALVFGLVGDLGAGKTAFVKSLSKNLNIKENVTSPTFVIQRRYKTNCEKLSLAQFKNLIHIDAYRMEGVKDFNFLDLDEDLKNNENLIFIEWPEILKDSFPKEAKKIYFKFIDENIREIKY